MVWKLVGGPKEKKNLVHFYISRVSCPKTAPPIVDWALPQNQENTPQIYAQANLVKIVS